jgi:hypothetical protein
MAHRPAPIAVILALVVAAAAYAGAFGAASGSTRAPEPPASPANEAAARADAVALLAQVPLPPGAVRSAIEPPGGGDLLAQPGLRTATPDLIDEHAWWVVPGGIRAGMAWVRAHLPAGVTIDSSASLGGPGVPDNESLALAWPPVTGVLGLRWLVVRFVALPDGSCGLRADAEVVWELPRPASETIPAGARFLRVAVHGSIRSNIPHQAPLTVTSPQAITQVRTLLNGLPVAQPGALSCPADFGIVLRLSFYARRHRSPLAVAGIDPDGCGWVSLTIRGRAQPTLEGLAALIPGIERAIGHRLNLSPPH